jgi:hypothetical protein
MREENTGRLANGFVGVISLVAAGAAAIIGLFLNIKFAYSESMDILIIIAFAFADVGEFLVPILAELDGWSVKYHAMFWVCVIASAVCVASTLADGQTAAMRGHTKDAREYASAKGKAGNARRTMGEIRETGDVAGLEVLVAEAKAAADREAARQKCAEKCEAAKTSYRALLDRLSSARSRDGAKAELAVAEAAMKGGPPKSQGLAELIAGGDPDREQEAARWFAISKFVLPLLVIKSFIWFLPRGAMRRLGVAFHRRREPIGAPSTCTIDGVAVELPHDPITIKKAPVEASSEHPSALLMPPCTEQPKDARKAPAKPVKRAARKRGAHANEQGGEHPAHSLETNEKTNVVPLRSKSRDEQVMELLKQGTSQVQVAKQFGISRATVQRIIKAAQEAEQAQEKQVL